MQPFPSLFEQLGVAADEDCEMSRPCQDALDSDLHDDGDDSSQEEQPEEEGEEEGGGGEEDAQGEEEEEVPAVDPQLVQAAMDKLNAFSDQLDSLHTRFAALSQDARQLEGQFTPDPAGGVVLPGKDWRETRTVLSQLHFDVGAVQEEVTRLLLRLDEVGSYGHDGVRSARKSLVVQANELADDAECLRAKVGAWVRPLNDRVFNEPAAPEDKPEDKDDNDAHGEDGDKGQKEDEDDEEEGDEEEDDEKDTAEGQATGRGPQSVQAAQGEEGEDAGEDEEEEEEEDEEEEEEEQPPQQLRTRMYRDGGNVTGLCFLPDFATANDVRLGLDGDAIVVSVVPPRHTAPTHQAKLRFPDYVASAHATARVHESEGVVEVTAPIAVRTRSHVMPQRRQSSYHPGYSSPFFAPEAMGWGMPRTAPAGFGWPNSWVF